MVALELKTAGEGTVGNLCPTDSGSARMLGKK